MLLSRNQALLEYLQASGYTAAAEALKREASVEEDAKQKGVLEKKWASIVRLQRKVCLIAQEECVTEGCFVLLLHRSLQNSLIRDS